MKTDNELIEDFWVSQGGKPNLPADTDFYSSSWDMIMPVVQKITPLAKEIGQQAWFDVDSALLSADIDQVYKRVVEFIKWYNATERYEYKR